MNNENQVNFIGPLPLANYVVVAVILDERASGLDELALKAIEQGWNKDARDFRIQGNILREVAQEFRAIGASIKKDEEIPQDERHQEHA